MTELQDLMDRSAADAGAHLRGTFELPDHALTARQLVRYWGSGQTIALATLGRDGTPRVAPVDSLLRGTTLWVPTAGDAAKVRHVRAKPRVAFTHWVASRVAVHGRGVASVVGPADPDFASIDATYVSPRADWFVSYRAANTAVYVKVALESVVAWAGDPTAFPN